MSEHPLERWHQGQKHYMPVMDFDPDDRSVYSVVVTAEDGPVVYSECCSDTIGLETAKVLHDALGRWIADREERADG